MRKEYHVLTPESVDFVYELAGLTSRLVAVLIDHLLILSLVLLLVLAGCLLGAGAMLSLAPTLGLPIIGAMILAAFILYFGYFVYFEVKWSGQTPGKRYAEIRVIDDRGMNADVFQILVRNILRLVDLLPVLLPLDFIQIGLYGVGGIAAFLNPYNKRIGDWAAGTLVVRVHKRVIPEAIIAPNEKYNTLQEDGPVRSRIRNRLTLEERETILQLCLRRNELEFEARQALFADAAAYLERRLEMEREPFLSEEKFVQNIAAVALAESQTLRNPSQRGLVAPSLRG
jgi:uncharacterized RDD family membrane protein YckC